MFVVNVAPDDRRRHLLSDGDEIAMFSFMGALLFGFYAVQPAEEPPVGVYMTFSVNLVEI